jgi:hypothetical protein
MRALRLALTATVLVLCNSALAQDNKPRVHVTDSESWETSGGFVSDEDGDAFGVSAGGARPQTAEIIKTFGERCPNAIVTMNKSKADYIVLLDHEGGKGILRRDNKFALFSGDGDVVDSGSTRSLGSAVKDACEAMLRHWHSGTAGAQSQEGVFSGNGLEKQGDREQVIEIRPVSDLATLSITTDPPGAEIEIDGMFAGMTPRSKEMQAGEHEIEISMKGYRNWKRKIVIEAGEKFPITVQLEKD